MTDIQTITLRVRPRPETLADLPDFAFSDRSTKLDAKTRDEAIQLLREYGWNLLITTDYGYSTPPIYRGAYVTPEKASDMIADYQEHWDHAVETFERASREGGYLPLGSGAWVLMEQYATCELIDAEEGEGK